MKVDTSTWSEFRIGDLFELYKGTRLTRANMIEGNIRFVSAANVNNGVTAYVGNNDRVHSEGTITVCYNGNGGTGKAFYQDKPYWASDDVHVLYPKFHLPNDFDGVEWTGLNSTVGLFLATAIEKVGRQKYGFTDKWKLECMREDRIKLPVQNDGSPDWIYIQSTFSSILKTSDNLIESVSNASIQKTTLDVSSWGIFQIGTLFDIRLALGDMKPQHLEAGDIPLISAGNEQNGVAMYCSRDGDGKSQLFPAGAITVSMFGRAFYQPEPFFAVSHGRCNILIPKYKISEPSGLFVSCVLTKALLNKYDYSTMCTATRLSNECIMLPQTDRGLPDWNYMDSFMDHTMRKAAPSIDRLVQIKMDNSIARSID